MLGSCEFLFEFVEFSGESMDTWVTMHQASCSSVLKIKLRLWALMSEVSLSSPLDFGRKMSF